MVKENMKMKKKEEKKVIITFSKLLTKLQTCI